MSSAAVGAYALSALDHQRFGVNTAKATCSTVDEWQQVQKQARADGVELALVRVPATALPVAQRLLAEGALLCDVLCFFERQAATTGAIHPPSSTSLEVRPVEAHEHEALVSFARRVFAGYKNHYTADSRLPAREIQEVYPDWLSRLSRGLDSRVWVLADDVAMRGVAALTGIGQDAWDVALFAIDPDSVGQGWGGMLLQHVVDEAAGSGCRHVTYSTQLHNLAARRMVTRAGFLPTSDVYVFHVWFDRWRPCK